MNTPLRISGPVRRQLGRTADALAAGIGLPPDAQCWQCGDAINLLAARPGSVTLSAVTAGVDLPVFGHVEHTVSRLFTTAQFQAAASTAPSPLAGGDEPTVLIDGQPIDRVVRIVGDRPGGPGKTSAPPAGSEALRRRALLELAAQVSGADSDEQALRIVREATGLSWTDPGADRAALQARVAAAEAEAEAERRALAEVAANRARGAKVYTVRCPGCGQLPDLVLNPGQAYCGNDEGCDVFQFAPDMDPFDQLANRSTIPSPVGPGGIPEDVAAAAAARRPVQVRGSGEDDGREAVIRDLFHRWGYTCADPNGSCAVCGWRTGRASGG